VQLLVEEAQWDVAWDMTPMIDCVFLLLTFFVLVIDLNQANLEDLILARASYQVPDADPPERRPVINVLQTGAVYYHGALQYDPALHGEDRARLQRLFALIRQTAGLRTQVRDVGGRRVDAVIDPVLVRADKWTEWRWIGEVMRRGAEAGFCQVELALSETDRELKRR
jgi:biopolymer transport protein ExbD